MDRPAPQTRAQIEEDLRNELVTDVATRFLADMHERKVDVPAMVHATAHALGVIVGNHFQPEQQAKVLAAAASISETTAEMIVEEQQRLGTTFTLRTNQEPT